MIATDKKITPSFVKKSATKLGAIVYSPKNDISVNEKISLTKNINTQNSHERDATAAVIYAKKEYSQKIEEINNFLKINYNKYYSDKSFINAFIHYYFKNPEKSYQNILSILEKEQLEKESLNLKNVNLKNKQNSNSLKRNLTSPVASNSNNSIIRNLLHDNQYLRNQNSELQKKLSSLLKNNSNSSSAKKTNLKTKSEKDLMTMLVQREKRLINLNLELKNQKKLNKKLLKNILKIRNLTLSNKLSIPRQLDFKKPPLFNNNISFIDNVNIYLPSSIKDLKEDKIILTKTKPSSKIIKLLSCTVILWEDDINYQESLRDIIFIDKEKLNKKMQSIDFTAIVKQYQESRKNN